MTYKNAIENIINFNVYRQITDKTDSVVTISHMHTETNNDETVSYHCFATVYNGITWHEYRVSGYLNEYGNCYICLVMFDRTYQNENGQCTRKSYFIHGEELNTFKYDI